MGGRRERAPACAAKNTDVVLSVKERSARISRRRTRKWHAPARHDKRVQSHATHLTAKPNHVRHGFIAGPGTLSQPLDLDTHPRVRHIAHREVHTFSLAPVGVWVSLSTCGAHAESPLQTQPERYVGAVGHTSTPGQNWQVVVPRAPVLPWLSRRPQPPSFDVGAANCLPPAHARRKKHTQCAHITHMQQADSVAHQARDIAAHACMQTVPRRDNR